MIRRRRLCFAMTMLSLVIPAAAIGDHTEVPASCPVTLPPASAFVPPGPYPQTAPAGTFWHGTAGLWTMLLPDGVHRGLPVAYRQQPDDIRMRNKSFWWSPGFHPTRTPGPELKIEGRRLDADAPPLEQPWVTNASVPEFGGWTMLTMLELPPLGCWEVTATRGADSVSFVVWVAPPPPRE